MHWVKPWRPVSLAILWLCLAWIGPAHGGMVINEVVASNGNSYTNALGDNPDWIEIYNNGTLPVDLIGWYLTDDAADLTKWAFSTNAVILQNDYLVVSLDGSTLGYTNGEFYANFKLSAGGEYLALVHSNGTTVVHEYATYMVSPGVWGFPPLGTDVSYGLGITNQFMYFNSPTPGAVNLGGASNFVADTKFSVDRGFYTNPIAVAITCKTPGAQIRYTLDAGTPTTNSLLYGAPIAITTTTMLRAKAFKLGLYSSNVDTHTYIFLEDIITQDNTPAGYPALWRDNLTGVPATVPADYEMDPEVTTNAAYSDMLDEAFLALPTISIVTDVENLFDWDTGIYMNTFDRGDLWTRAASTELIFPDGTDSFQINCGLAIQGGHTRQPLRMPKHSFRLRYQAAFGPTKLKYDFFGDGAVTEFDRIVLRATGNQSWLHSNGFLGDNRGRAQYIRDLWAKDALNAMGWPASHNRYFHLYLNGMYWGVYAATELEDEDFGASYYGGMDSDYETFNDWVEALTVPSWNSLMALADSGVTNEVVYQQLQQELDLDAFIDYMLMNHYGGNLDWDTHNWRALHDTRSDGKYRFLPWDSEFVFIAPEDNRVANWWANSPHFIYDRLQRNTEFQLRFADHIQQYCFNDGPLTTNGAVALWNRRSYEIWDAIVCESARWGDHRRDLIPLGAPLYLYTRDEHWMSERNRLLQGYFPVRTEIVLQQYRDINLFPDLAAPVFSQHGGMITRGARLGILASSAVYYTMDPSDPRQYGTGTPRGTLFGGGVLVLDRTAQVGARTYSGGTWSAISRATFVLDTPSTLRITELMYHPRAPQPVGVEADFSRSDFEYVELQNVGSETIGLAGIEFNNGIYFDFTESEVQTLDPGEFVLVVRNRAAFTARYAGAATMKIAGEFHGTYMIPTSALSDKGESLRLVDGLGRTLHSFSYNDTWQPATDGEGYSLVIVDAQGDPADWDSWSSWRPSAAIDGSPGAADGSAPYPRMVVINEILTHQDTYPPGDWIELHNLTSNTVDLGGWSVSDERGDLARYTLPGGTELLAGEYLVLTESGSFGTNAIGARGFGLSELGEEAYLSTGAGAIIDRREFGAAERDVTFGRHVKRDGVAVDFTALSAGTAGSSNAYPKVGPVVISEIMYNPASPADYEFVEFHNLSDSAVALYDVAHPTNTWRVSGAVDYAFPSGSTLPAHGYAVLAPVDRASFEAVYGTLPAGVALYGPYTGKLDNAGETIYLSKPGDPEPVSGLVPQIVAERVNYGNAAPWPGQANGMGPSLERIVAAHYGNDYANWVSIANRGSPGLPPPVILIASPASGTAFSVPFSTTVTAAIDGTQVSGSIQRVDFLMNGNVVSTDFVAPWEYVLDHTLITNAGAYTLTARLVDGAGTNTSPGVVIHTTMATRIAVTAPYSGAGFLAPPPASIVATVYPQFIIGAIQRVEFLVDGSPLGVDADTAPPYQFPLTSLTNQATYRLSAVLEDDFMVSTSDEITIHVYTNAPLTAVVDAQTVNINRHNTTPLNAGLDLRGWSAELVSTTWVFQSGPGAVVIKDASLPVTSASFSAPGTYVFMLITTYGTHSETNYTTVTVLDANVRNTIPYQESFEGYFDGKPIVGIDGWEADDIWAGTVVTGDYASVYTNTTPLAGAEHELVLQIAGVISNLFEDTVPYSNIWVDTMIETGRWVSRDPPGVSASTHLAFFIDVDGYLNLWSCVTPGAGNSNGWTRLEHAPLASNGWARVTIEADYNRQANGYFYFRAWLNEAPLTQPATWFASANTNRNYLSKFTILGEYGVDDVVVSDYDVLNPPPIQIASPGHGTAFKVPFSTVVTAAIDGTRVSGSIERVDFAVDDVIVGSTSSPPWQFVLDHTVITHAGDYLLRAFLVDASGTTASPVVRISATMATRIVVTEPFNEAAFLAPPQVAVVAAVNSLYTVGNIKRVEFLVDGSPLGTDADANAPYEFPLTSLTNQATYRLRAVVEDDFGASTSDEIVIHVFSNAPLTTVGGPQTININRYNTVPLDGALALRGWSNELVATAWMLSSGPGTVVFDDASQAMTSASFSAPGTYVLMLITTYGTYSETNTMTVTVLDANVRNTIPYAESFEKHYDGKPLMGLDGWDADSLWAGTVVTGDYAAVYAGPYPLLDAEHELVLRADGTLSNVFENTAPYTNVWVDAVFEARRCDVSQLPVMGPATQGGFYFDSDGYINAWNCVTPGAGHSHAWTKLQHSPLPADAWARVTLEVDYNRRPDGHFYFRMWLNGQALVNPVTWFAAASTNRNYLSTLKATGAGAFDDMVVDDYDLLNYRKLTASVSGNGTIQPAGEVLVPIHGGTNFVATPAAYWQVLEVLTNGVPYAGTIQSPHTLLLTNVIARWSVEAWFAELLATNGTPYAWLAQFGWTNNFDYYAMQDTDGDGLAAWQEHEAGTHPTNAASVLAITDLQETPAGRLIRWLSVTNRFYDVFGSTNLLEAWPAQPLVNGINGDPSGTTGYQDTELTNHPAVYRVRVRMP